MDHFSHQAVGTFSVPVEGEWSKPALASPFLAGFTTQKHEDNGLLEPRVLLCFGSQKRRGTRSPVVPFYLFWRRVPLVK